MWVPGSVTGRALTLTATLVHIAGALGCGDVNQSGTDSAGATWLTRPEFRIGDSETFSSVSFVRATADGRVFVLEPRIATLSVFTFDGAPLMTIGNRGDGPGEFVMPTWFDVSDEGFHVRDERRFTFYSRDGSLIKTVPHQPPSVSYQGFPIVSQVVLEDGGFLGTPSIGATIQLGWADNEPFLDIPILHLFQTPNRWRTEAVFLLDDRNSTFAARGPEVPAGYFAAQPFANGDLYRMDSATGTAVIVRRNLGAGRAEILEIDPSGDTLWYRELVLPVLELSRARVDAVLDERTAAFDRITRNAIGPIPTNRLREMAEDALFVPEYLPSVSNVTVASTGEVWLQSWEESDTLRAWYSIRRREQTQPPRRLLLPHWFRVLDATETHVWGIWRDELDVPYVVGRRLVPGQAG